MGNNGYNLAASFRFALRGVVFALKSERNLRIHFAAAALAFWFARYFSLSPVEWSVLVATIGLVIVCELINTAIEASIDLTSPSYSHLAKTAKDVAAAAVLVSAGASVVVGWLLLRDQAAWRRILNDILAWPAVWLAVVLVCAAWIILPGNKRKM